MTNKPTTKTIEELLADFRKEFGSLLDISGTTRSSNPVNGRIEQRLKQSYRLGAEMMSEKLIGEREETSTHKCRKHKKKVDEFGDLICITCNKYIVPKLDDLEIPSRNKWRAEQRQIAKKILGEL